MRQIVKIRKKLKEKIKVEKVPYADVAHQLRMSKGGLSLFLNGYNGLSGPSTIYALMYLDEKLKKELERF